MVAEALKDTAHDAVAAAVDFNAHLRAVAIADVLYIVGLDVAILQRDAFGDTVHVGYREVVVEVYVIDFLLSILGMSQFGSQLAIVRKEEYARGVAVEATDGVDTLAASSAHEVHDGATVLGVVACRHVALGLIEQYVHFLLWAHRVVVEDDIVSAQHLGAEFGHHLTVHAHHTCFNVAVGITTRTDAGIGQILVKANGCIGVDVFLLILVTLFL